MSVKTDRFSGNVGYGATDVTVSPRGGASRMPSAGAGSSAQAIGEGLKGLASLIPTIIKGQKVAATNKEYRSYDQMLSDALTAGKTNTERRALKDKWIKQRQEAGVSSEIINTVLRQRPIVKTKDVTRGGVTVVTDEKGNIYGNPKIGPNKRAPSFQAADSVMRDIVDTKEHFPITAEAVEKSITEQFPENEPAKYGRFGSAMADRTAHVANVLTRINKRGLGTDHINIDDMDAERLDNSSELTNAISQVANILKSGTIAEMLDSKTNLLSKADPLVVWNGFVSEVREKFNQNPDLYSVSMSAKDLNTLFQNLSTDLRQTMDYYTASTSKTLAEKLNAQRNIGYLAQEIEDQNYLSGLEKSQNPADRAMADFLRKSRVGMLDAMSDIREALIKTNDEKSAQKIMSNWLNPITRAEGRNTLTTLENDLKHPGKQITSDIMTRLTPILQGVMGVIDGDFSLRVETLTNNYIKYLREYAKNNENRVDLLEAAQLLENQLKTYQSTMVLGKKAVK